MVSKCSSSQKVETTLSQLKELVKQVRFLEQEWEASALEQSLARSVIIFPVDDVSIQCMQVLKKTKPKCKQRRNQPKAKV